MRTLIPLLLLTGTACLCACAACGTEGAAPVPAEPAREVVIIDTDTTAFEPETWDLEDDIAVLFAMADPGLEIRGLTITYGNGTREQTFRDALLLVSLTGLDLPVLAGADWSAQDLWQSTPASQFIIDTARAAAGGITLIALGAMTNVASALVQAPEIVEKIDRILIMGGNLEPHWTRLSVMEVNFSADAEATNVVFDTPVPKVLLPSETCVQTVVSRKQLDRIHEHPETVIHAFVDRMESYHQLWTLVHDLLYPPPLYPQKVSGGFIPWDSITVAYATHPELFREPACYGVRMIDGTLRAEPCQDLGDHRFKVTVPLRLDREGFDEELMNHVLSVRRVPG
jgi:inosine-uridine nucleoside N-ribohydrolase